MRQIWIPKNGPPQVMQIKEGPDPIPRNGEVRIRVQACGVTFADVLARMGSYPNAPQPPFIPGYEVAGVIDLVAQGVSDFKEGEAVFALTPLGGYSDVVCVSHKLVFRRLEWMSMEDAAALPMNYLTAYMMLVEMGSLKAHDRVLIHSAAGGVGLAALDICRIMGALPYGTASTAKHDFLRSRGLVEPIDYHRVDYEREMMRLTENKGVQIVLDPLGGMHWPKNYRLLAPGGRLVHYGISSIAPGVKRSRLKELRGLIMLPFYTPVRLMRDNKAVMGVDLPNLWQQGGLRAEWMEQLVAWYDEALFRPHIDRTFPFAQVAEAHRYLQERQSRGKVLLIPE